AQDGLENRGCDGLCVRALLWLLGPRAAGGAICGGSVAARAQQTRRRPRRRKVLPGAIVTAWRWEWSGDVRFAAPGGQAITLPHIFGREAGDDDDGCCG
ncbi:unnamed protein product, partial [Ectocarpus sp. 4 AP-2014]